MTTIAFIGLGELACSFAAGMRDAGVDLRGYSRPRADPDRAGALRRRTDAACIRVLPSLEEAVRGAPVVVAAVPSSAASEVTAQVVGLLEPGCVYVDTAPSAPARKAADGAVVAAAGGRYADVAVLRTVAIDGHRVPLLAAGPGACAWSELATSLGMNVTVVDGPPGTATRVKLLRSVYMKGRDALIAEMLLAARAGGIDDEVIASIGGPAERVPFAELAHRVICALSIHAERRADELAASADLLAEHGIEPIMVAAGERRLRALADLGLREHFRGERADDPRTVLAAVEMLATNAPRGRLAR